MTTPKVTRHRWHPVGISEAFPGAYAVSECVKCGCLKIHLYDNGFRSKKFLLNSVYHDKTPACNS